MQSFLQIELVLDGLPPEPFIFDFFPNMLVWIVLGAIGWQIMKTDLFAMTANKSSNRFRRMK